MQASPQDSTQMRHAAHTIRPGSHHPPRLTPSAPAHTIRPGSHHPARLTPSDPAHTIRPGTSPNPNPHQALHLGT